MRHKTNAVSLLRYYLEFGMTAAGNRWDSDNTSEVEELVDCIVYAAAAEMERRQPQRDPNKPTGPTTAYIRNLEAAVSEAVDILSGLLVQDDTGLVFVSSANGEVIARAVKFLEATKGDDPQYPCEACGTDVYDPKNLHSAQAHGRTYQVCDDCAHQHHLWQEVA